MVNIPSRDPGTGTSGSTDDDQQDSGTETDDGSGPGPIDGGGSGTGTGGPTPGGGVDPGTPADDGSDPGPIDGGGSGTGTGGPTSGGGVDPGSGGGTPPTTSPPTGDPGPISDGVDPTGPGSVGPGTSGPTKTTGQPDSGGIDDYTPFTLGGGSIESPNEVVGYKDGEMLTREELLELAAESDHRLDPHHFEIVERDGQVFTELNEAGETQIDKIQASSAAAAAGVSPNDVTITAYSGEELEKLQELADDPRAPEGVEVYDAAELADLRELADERGSAGPEVGTTSLDPGMLADVNVPSAVEIDREALTENLIQDVAAESPDYGRGDFETAFGTDIVLTDDAQSELEEQRAGDSPDSGSGGGGFLASVGGAIPDVVADPAQSGVDRFQAGADDVVRDLSGGDVGISQDFTSTEDSGGLSNTVGVVTDPILRRGREFQQTRAEEGEQFGDFDWSAGLGGEEDEVENFVDSLPGRVRGVTEPAAETLFSEDVIGESGGHAILDWAGYEGAADAYDRTLRNFATGLVSEPLPALASIPGATMEGVETFHEARTNPESVSDVPAGLAASAAGTYDAARENPAQMTGGIVGSTALFMSPGTAASIASASARATRRATPSRPSLPKTDTYSPGRMLAGDDRGQMNLVDLVPGRRGGDSDSSILPDNIDEMLGRFESADRGRRANQRAEDRFIDEQLEAGRRQERARGPRTVSDGPGGDYTAPTRGGDYVASRGPSPRLGSGPTAAQRSIQRGPGSNFPGLSARQSQLAARIQRQTPTGDLRSLDAIERSTPLMDLRATGSASSSPALAIGGAATGSLSDPVGEMLGLQSAAEQRSVDVADTTPPGVMEDTAIGGIASGESGSDGLLSSDASTLGLEGVGSSSLFGDQAGITPLPGLSADLGSDVATGSDTSTDTAVGADTDEDTRSRSRTKQAAESAFGSTTPAGGATPFSGRPGLGSPGLPGLPGIGRPGRPGRPMRPRLPDLTIGGGSDRGEDTGSAGGAGLESGDIGPGWFSESVTDIGTLGLELPGSPDQDKLGDLSAGTPVAYDLPTAQLVDGDEDVEAAANLFTFDGEGSGGSGGSPVFGDFELDLGTEDGDSVFEW